MKCVTGLVVIATAVATMSRANDPDLEHRWTAVTSGTMETPSCSLRIYGLGNVEGLSGRFMAMRGGGLHFDPMSNSEELPGGGVLRIDLPGAMQPWLLDTEYAIDRAEPRAQTLRDELASGRVPKMTIESRRGKVLPVTFTMENWAVASAMFDACVRAMPGLRPGKPESFTTVRHAVEEFSDDCELNATYQLHGAGIWIVLTTDGGNPALKVTQRALEAGSRLGSMDLSKLGGPRRVTSPDTTLRIGATKFAELRRALVGSGVEFGMTSSPAQVYAVPFGGKIARIEAAMFEACVNAKAAQ